MKKACPNTVVVGCCLLTGHKGECLPTRPTTVPGIRRDFRYTRMELTVTPPEDADPDPQLALDIERIMKELAWTAKAAVRYLETRHKCKFDVVMDGKAYPTTLPGQ